jgi:hypothetical protein
MPPTVSTHLMKADTVVHSQTQWHTHAHTRTHVHVHARTHVHTHAHTHAHTHTHTQSSVDMEQRERVLCTT